MKCRDAVLAAAMLLAITLPAHAGIAVQAWGGVDGQGVDLFILTNAKGTEARITNYGAVITAVRVPGRDGAYANRIKDNVQDTARIDVTKDCFSMKP